LGIAQATLPLYAFFVPDAFITVELEGDEAVGGDLQLNQFIEELTAIRMALRQTERLVLPLDDNSVRYRVTGLSHSSPSKVTIGISSREPAYANIPKRITRRFAYGLSVVRRNHRYAERIDLKTLQTFKAMASPATKHKIRLTVSTEQQRVIRIDREFDAKVTRLIAGDERERDELVGRVERIDIHNKNMFDIYPLLGPERVRCNAPRRMQDKVVEAIGKIVMVEGWALYRKDAPFPYAMTVEDIHLRKPDSELPTMRSLHGTAPDATGGISAEEFVRNLRDAYW
jgi:hypothetical protein